MIVTPYSSVTALLLFSLLIVIGHLLFIWRKDMYYLYDLRIFLFLVAVSLARIALPIELPWLTRVIRSDHIYPSIQDALTAELPHASSMTILHILGIVAVSGSAVLLIRSLMSFCCEHQFFSTLHPSTDPRIQKIMSDITCSQNYSIVETDSTDIAFCIGMSRLTIVLPRFICELPDGYLRHVLLHEWQHYKSKDVWFLFAVELVCILLWWNPAVYLLKKDIVLILEKKCDLLVTQDYSKKQQVDYMEAMLMINSLQIDYIEGKYKELANREPSVQRGA